jgi:hypothetical protein
VTLVELHHAGARCSGATLRVAVVAGLLECPPPEVPADPHFADLVVFWLTDPDTWDWFPPPLPETTIAAIYRHLIVGAN